MARSSHFARLFPADRSAFLADVRGAAGSTQRLRRHPNHRGVPECAVGRFVLGVGNSELLAEHVPDDRWPSFGVRPDMLEEADGARDGPPGATRPCPAGSRRCSRGHALRGRPAIGAARGDRRHHDLRRRRGGTHHPGLDHVNAGSDEVYDQQIGPDARASPTPGTRTCRRRSAGFRAGPVRRRIRPPGTMFERWRVGDHQRPHRPWSTHAAGPAGSPRGSALRAPVPLRRKTICDPAP
jgi:hypothetical protein